MGQCRGNPCRSDTEYLSSELTLGRLWRSECTLRTEKKAILGLGECNNEGDGKSRDPR